MQRTGMVYDADDMESGFTRPATKMTNPLLAEGGGGQDSVVHSRCVVTSSGAHTSCQLAHTHTHLSCIAFNVVRNS